MTHTLFSDRNEAGRRLAKQLDAYHGSDALILAIPRGGIPVAAAAAHRLRLNWGTIVARKLPVPWNPEAGFGAVTADGTTVLNEAMVNGLQLRQRQIDQIVSEVQIEVQKRTAAYSKERPALDLAGQTIIVVDDGLASGYTMLAAIKSACRQNPAKVIAAAPVASRSAANMMEQAADECVFDIVSPSVPFAVADFYVAWRDLSDDDVIPILRSGP